MNLKDLYEEKALLKALERREIRAFMKLYQDYGEDLLILAYMLLQNSRLAALTVDIFFEDLWQNGQFDKIRPPIYKYLVEEIRKMCSQRP